jgi:hypothetical protein
MAARSVRAFIHNETNSDLTLIREEVPDGEWGAGRPPSRIPAWMTAPMGSESDGFLTGTEARATYQIGGDPSQTIYVHWNNPFSGDNSYHTNTDPAHDSFYTAISGNHAVVNYVLRPSRRVVTDFLPSRDGFKFANHWPDTPYSLPPLRGSALDLKYGNAANGLCGGMVFAALDYFNAGQQIPQDMVAPFGEQVPLFVYLVDRLFDTFTTRDVLMMLSLMNPAYPDTDENPLSVLGLADGRAAVMAHQEWPAIRADIDAGRPSPLFVQTVKSLLPTDLGKFHQVLAYAYEARGHDVTIWVYDPNQPLVNEVTMRFDDGDVGHRIVVQHNVDVKEDDHVHIRPIYCFGRMDYSPKPPRVPTRPRVTSAEVESRGVQVDVSDFQVLEHVTTRRGRKKFTVIPDCGEKEFEFEIAAEKTLQTLTVSTHGYVTPIITWFINGVEVAPGDRDLVVSGAWTEDNFSPVTFEEEDSTPIEIGPVTVHVSLHHPHLTITNNPVDGNYAFMVRVACEEFGETAVSSRHSRQVTFLGARERVFGLKEAIDQCLVSYYDRLRTEQPDDEAIVNMIFSQLGRPLDPIWDPDPTVLPFDSTLERENPNWDTIEASLTPDTIEIPDLTEVGVDPGTTEGIPDDSITEES